MQFPSESESVASTKPPTPPDSIADGKVPDSQDSFDDHEILETSSDEVIEPDGPVLDEEDGEESNYLDRLKSVFGDK